MSFNTARLPRLPPAWCCSCQEICETRTEFKAYHAGIFTQDNIVKGMLLTAHTAPSVRTRCLANDTETFSRRDGFFFGGRIIITHT